MARLDSDLTAAARIREAALRLFAERGVAATSIRDVARVAGVSPGLVQHHFRSKARLRRAVEDSVIHRATESFGRPIGGGSPSESSTRIGSKISDFIRENPAIFAYVGRSLLEGDSAGLALFEALFRIARAQVDDLVAAGLVRSDLDRDWNALHVILIDVGAYLFEPALSRCLGESPLSDKGLKRMEKATETLFLKGVYRPERRRGGSTKRRRSSS
jgi:TetR/AcrR family transcriptional regulator, regulator of cefoperazone and chloramphenicol sensitivity